MNILNVNTGNEKLDEAYKNIQVHICTFDKFVEFKYGRTQNKHDFDILLERVSPEKKEQLEKWLKDNLEKVKG